MTRRICIDDEEEREEKNRVQIILPVIIVEGETKRNEIDANAFFLKLRRSEKKDDFARNRTELMQGDVFLLLSFSLVHPSTNQKTMGADWISKKILRGKMEKHRQRKIFLSKKIIRTRWLVHWTGRSCPLFDAGVNERTKLNRDKAQTHWSVFDSDGRKWQRNEWWIISRRLE